MQIFGRFLWLSWILVMVMLTISFAISNKSLITLYLWPLDGALTAPTWLLVLSSFIVGGLLSTTLLWAQSLATRTKLWLLQGKLSKLQALLDNERELETFALKSQDQESGQTMPKSLLVNRVLRKG